MPGKASLTTPTTENERLARIEVTTETLLRAITEMRASLEKNVAELTRRDEELRTELNSRLVFCAGRNTNADSYFGKVREMEKQVEGIEKTPRLTPEEITEYRKTFPALLELVGIKNRILVLVAISGFVGTAAGGSLVAFVFSRVIGAP